MKELNKHGFIEECFSVEDKELIQKLKGFYIEDKQVKIVYNEKYDVFNWRNEPNTKVFFKTKFGKFLVDFNTKGLLGKNEDYLIVQQLGEK